ncbi:MAG: hypothetical protein ACRCR2_02270 [Fusobacteriaceae bacterium]
MTVNYKMILPVVGSVVVAALSGGTVWVMETNANVKVMEIQLESMGRQVINSNQDILDLKIGMNTLGEKFGHSLDEIRKLQQEQTRQMQLLTTYLSQDKHSK